MIQRLPLRVQDVCLDPELATLAVLDAALDAARTALIAEHPDAGNLDRTTDALPPVVVLAGLVITRADELASLLAHYRRALEDFRLGHSGTDMPF